MKQYIAAVVALLLVGCPRTYEPKPAPVPEDTNWCGEAEKNLKALQCKDRAGDPMWVNKKGERFTQTCKIAQREGVIFLNPRCVAGATDCDQAKQCPADGM